MSSNQPPSKKSHQETQSSVGVTEIKTDECCVCFELYSENVSGVEWIECACGRWLHENCGEQCIIDTDGKAKYAKFKDDL